MWIWQLYQNEINFFERKADELLVETIIHETKMDKRKQQQLQPTEEDIDHLLKMIVSTLKAIAVTDQNMRLFYAKRDEHFENLLIVFLLKIKNSERIDFTINR